MSEVDFSQYVIDVPDFPTPGIIFKDITPLLADCEAFGAAIKTIADEFADAGITKVVGSEARGFMFAAPIALSLHAGFVPARKPGKLPRQTLSGKYALEYGFDELQIHADDISADDVVLVIDDLLATGGTAIATTNLCKQTGAKIAGMGFFIELAFLNPREAVAKEFGEDFKVVSLVKVD